MSHLLAVSIGPVQEWIAAARRTRDLWFGSLLLSEISKAAAYEIQKQAKLMIFPAEIPGDGGTIANVILAEVENEEQAEALQKAAHAAAENAWKRYANNAKERVQQHIDSGLWDEQADDVIEFYAAWAPLTEYRAARQNVMCLLAGRKACRNFRPVRGRSGVPKSSLDGARESVWRRGFQSNDLSPEVKIALRLSPGEELDCVGLTKRLGAKQKQNFPSVSRIAAEPWIQRLSEGDLAQLRKECEKLGERVLGSVGWDHYKKYPFEGTAIYRNRYREIEEERDAKGQLRSLSQTVLRLEKEYGCPNPYLAVLIADGDRMGAYISRIQSAEEHREFSSKLGSFAQSAGPIVEEHSGCLVYAGGDDVLAFLPLHRVLSCARRLHESFHSSIPEASLSVGVAIGHFMEPLEDLLAYARDAERRAKLPNRNGLAIHLHPRSGSAIRIRHSWKDDPDLRLAQWSELIRNREISSKAAYDLHELARDYENWPDERFPRETIIQDVLRLLSRKELTEAGRAQLQQRLDTIDSHKTLNDLAEELLVARQITDAQLGGAPS